MNFGQGAITIQGLQNPGPPFIPTSAVNGTSIDPISGKIVLGNDVGGVLATLLSRREIPMAGFSIAFHQLGVNKFLVDPVPLIGGAKYLLGDAGATGGRIFIDDTAATETLSIRNLQTGASPSIQLTNLASGTRFLFGASLVASINTGGISLGTAPTPSQAPLHIGTSNTAGAIVSSISGGGWPTAGYASNTPGTLNVVHAGGNYGLTITRATATTGATNMAFYKTRNADPNVRTPPLAGDFLGRIEFQAPRTSDNLPVTACYFQAGVGFLGANFVSGGFSWATTNQAGSLAVRMILDEQGQFAIGTGVLPVAGVTMNLSGLIRVPGTAGNTFNWNVGAAAPAPVVAVPVFVDYYGTGGTRALSEPNNWVLVNIAGVNHKIPAYL